jgi:hypothetical protein
MFPFFFHLKKINKEKRKKKIIMSHRITAGWGWLSLTTPFWPRGTPTTPNGEIFFYLFLFSFLFVKT